MISLLLFLSIFVQASPNMDEAVMNKARVAFERGDFSEAHELYSKVPKNSDYWLQSLEEQAWTYIREKKFEKALSLYHTLSTPAFAPQVGPEAYLIGAYASLRICDYKSVFSVFKDFKARFQKTARDLENLSDDGVSESSQRLFGKLASNEIKKWADLGEDVGRLPQFVNRDIKLLDFVKTGKAAQAQERLKVLADADLKSIGKITKKMKIIEIEAIQRMQLKDHPEVANVKSQTHDTDEMISFEKEDDETWLDEVTRYRVSTEGCPVKGAQVGKK